MFFYPDKADFKSYIVWLGYDLFRFVSMCCIKKLVGKVY